MEDRIAFQKQIQRQQATEDLYSDSRLRDALDDEQAEVLLAWGLQQIESAIEAAEPEQLMARDDGNIEETTKAVKSVIRMINRMTTELPQASLAQSREYLMLFVDALCDVDARTVQVSDMLALEDLANNREEMEGDAIFRRLVDVILSGESGADEDAPSREEAPEEAPSTQEPSSGGETAPSATVE
ncbi:MAG: hypothetical protein R3272_12185 [Candidatus Promineifilaceae bacterium]|nr:hypothetical protein [Candidatus Promineifilaceae bacterium]